MPSLADDRRGPGGCTGNEDVRHLACDVINTQANQRGMLLGSPNAWDLPKSSQQPPMSWMSHDTGSLQGMDYTPHDDSLMPGMATNTRLTSSLV